jgi:DMSO/TMAO reductase YedYZ molybdopterin-dependent catalytic subunit
MDRTVAKATQKFGRPNCYGVQRCPVAALGWVRKLSGVLRACFDGGLTPVLPRDNSHYGLERPMYVPASALPPGQRERPDFPRFGLGKFATRFPKCDDSSLTVGGDVTVPCRIDAELASLERVEQRSDFHCVTTWSTRALCWSGYRFRDVYERLIVPRAAPSADAQFVVLRCQDGYASNLALPDLLADDVLLADRLHGKPLEIVHGAPLRLIAPAHYGYKNPKHVHAIEFWKGRGSYRFPALRFMDHPRARVAHEERGAGVPGWLLRYLYRPLVGATVRQFDQALARHLMRDEAGDGAARAPHEHHQKRSAP